ncbi:hypothetical protein GNF68_15095 [Clostridium perfringens]|uniref:Zinc ribbon domain-containing protein n=1 Tax=Clostridium perfringens TaxID=1502 RepID=A0AAW9I144_CLOPF|nr:hypothetical protein [Clostridium perfringens]MDZ4910338.1 hypothetical protein [Clostridium perfringens]
MICKECGAMIKHNEEYCRKCGALVINFKKSENKALKNICVENNARGKWQSFINKISNKDIRDHKVKEIDKHNLNDLGNLVNKYNKSVKNILSEDYNAKGNKLKK